MMRALHRKSWRDSLHYRGQLIAITAVVICGIALFVSLRSMHGFLRDTRDQYYEQSRFAQVFAPVTRAPQHVVMDVLRLDGVAAAEGRVVTTVILDVPGLAEPASGRLVSLPMAPAAINAIRLTSGRWPVASHRGEVLASTAFAKANALAPGDSIGGIFGGRWQYLHIAGTGISPEFVYEIGAGMILPDNRRFGVFWMPHESLAAAMGMTGAWNDLVVLATPQSSVPELLVGLDRLLWRYGGAHAYGRSEQTSDQFLSGEIDETQVTSLSLPLVFLGVVAFLLHTVLRRLVSLQRDQIATLRAFGYTPWAIAVHYLGIAFVPVVVGCVLGGVLGLWLASYLAGVYVRFFQFPPSPFTPDFTVVLQAVAIGTLAGAVGALGAVRRGVSLAPAEAMRPEPPTQFTRGLVERVGVRESPRLAMITRNLGHRPWKSTLSVVGLALAGGLVITALGMFDAVNFMKVLQFDVSDRADITLGFRSPLPEPALANVRRLPGVLDAEALRILPVVLRHETASYRTAVTALDDAASLRRLVDLASQPHPMPPIGLLLSRTLADSLGVHVGDTMTVDVLEGERRSAQADVVGVVDDLLGVSAYASLAELQRFAGGVAVISGAALQVDKRRLDSLYLAVKQLPVVTGVSVREAMRNSFEATIGESFAISLTVMLGFAAVIAFGIIYNNARVALSERGRELASLRILGFTHREVATVLLGEQGVLLALALPLGVVVAWGLMWAVTQRFESTLFRIPIVISGTSMVLGSVGVLAAAGVTARLVVRRLRKLDLVEVLKTRE